MNKCNNPEHPHCTVWVMPGDSTCAHGHAQPAPTPVPAGPASVPAAGPAMRRAADRTARPQLHVSGFDPRAAGGRQAIRLSLRGMPAGLAPELAMLAQSDLHLHGGERHVVTRTLEGEWRPVLLEFSSRGLEHGQHRIDIELHSRGEGGTRTWVCTLVILVPRADATLGDIHQAFLATHKNVRVSADDASIARVNAQAAGRIDIDVTARDASIAQLNLDAPAGRQDLGFSTIAWDEDLSEIDVPDAEEHPCPASAACIINAAAQAPRHLRVFAAGEFVLGRFEPVAAQAQVLLAHYGPQGAEHGGLTRRLSGRHALVRRGREGFEIEDVSRYGLLVDGAWPGRQVPVLLRAGMRIGLTASIRDVVVLVVAALLPHGVVFMRDDAGREAECFMLLEPETHPGEASHDSLSTLAALRLPLVFHRHGGFWHVDPATGTETPLEPALRPGALAGMGRRARFAAGAYPETWVARVREGDRRRLRADGHTLPLPGLPQCGSSTRKIIAQPASNTASSENTMIGIRR